MWVPVSASSSLLLLYAEGAALSLTGDRRRLRPFRFRAEGRQLLNGLSYEAEPLSHSKSLCRLPPSMGWAGWGGGG